MQLSVRHSTLAMEKCPNELLLHIFRFACDDDGTTGRCLSLVSRHIHLFSKEYKLQSIAVVGIAQMVSFAAMLAAIPARYRRIRHLFISTLPQVVERARHNNVHAPAITSKQTTHISHEHHYTNACTAFSQILHHVSSTIKTFHLVTRVPRSVSLIPVSCPNLVDLTLQGPFPAMLYPHEAPSFPSLRHLNFYSFHDHPSYLFEDIATQAPSLTHLSLFPAQPSRNLHGDLFCALDIEIPRSWNGHHFTDFVSCGILPPTIVEVQVQPGPDTGSDSRTSSCLENVQEIMKRKLLYMQKHDKLRRVKYIPPRRAPVFEEALLDWLDAKSTLMYS